MKKISIAMYSTLSGTSFKAPQLSLLIKQLKKNNMLGNVYGLYRKTDKAFFGEYLYKNIKTTKFIPYILHFLNKIQKGIFKDTYHNYLLGEWLIGQRFKRQLKIDKSDIVFLKPRPLSLVKVAKKNGKKVIIEAGELHPRYSQEVISKERELMKLNEKTIFENEYAVSQFEESFEYADKIIVLSEQSKKTFIEHNVPNHKLAVINLGVEGIFSHNEKIEEYDEKKDLIFVTTAFHSTIKGTHRLLKIWKEIQHKGVKLYVIGGIHNDIQEFINKNAPFQNVVFTGEIPKKDIIKIYRDHNAVGILNSLAEGYGRTVIEYLSQGMPVIVTPVATCDLIEDGINGYIVNYDDESRMKACILKFINNNKLYDKIKKNNSELKLRDLNEYIIELLKVMEEL